MLVVLILYEQRHDRVRRVVDARPQDGPGHLAELEVERLPLVGQQGLVLEVVELLAVGGPAVDPEGADGPDAGRREEVEDGFQCGGLIDYGQT